MITNRQAGEARHGEWDVVVQDETVLYGFDGEAYQVGDRVEIPHASGIASTGEVVGVTGSLGPRLVRLVRVRLDGTGRIHSGPADRFRVIG